MLFLKLSQWPDVFQRDELSMVGVLISLYPLALFSSLTRLTSSLYIMFPFGCQKGIPGASSWKLNRPISFPIFLWSLFAASSMIVLYCSSSFFVKNEIP